MPKYSPGFDILVSLDSDAQVQFPFGITDLIAGALLIDIAAIPEIHPSYTHLYSPDDEISRGQRETFAAI